MHKPAHEIRILGVIPARGGSKGVPRKNIKLLGGKPLIQYTIESAKDSGLMTDLVVSTDDPEIESIATSLGASSPFLRPARLAQDDTPTLPVLQHLIIELQQTGRVYDAVCLLQPTSPLRPAHYISGCVELLVNNNLDACFTMREIPHEFNPHWAFKADSDGHLRIATGDEKLIPRRQELPKAYIREGSVYLTTVDCLLNKDSLYGEKFMGYLTDSAAFINIDTLADWAEAEKYFETLSQEATT